VNPLDTGEIFQFEGLNPNPSFSKTKDGPVFRVSFEVTQEQWEDFVNGNTAGMIVEAQMRVTEQHVKPEEKPKGGKMSIQAAMMCKEPDFQEYAAYVFDTIEPETKHIIDEATAKNLVYRKCLITSRSELDHLDESAKLYGELMAAYNVWCSKKDN